MSNKCTINNPLLAQMNRRRFLQVSGSGAVIATSFGASSLLPNPAQAADTFTWISPRGTCSRMFSRETR